MPARASALLIAARVSHDSYGRFTSLGIRSVHYASNDPKDVGFRRLTYAGNATVHYRSKEPNSRIAMLACATVHYADGK
jgi:hypothetical protein